MEFWKSPIVRISFGLVIVTISALLLSDFLGLVPDTKRAEISSRKAIAESLAVQFSMVITDNQLDSVQETLKLLVERNDDVKSAALRKDGELIAGFGDHGENWTLKPEDNSTANQIQVPLFDGTGIWGTVELSFVDRVQSTRFFLNGSFPAVVALVALCGFFGYFFFLKRALQELDPSAVIPERVRLALDTLSEGLIIVDQHNNIVFSNHAFADRVGVTPHDLVGRQSESLPWEVDHEIGEPDELPWNNILRGDDTIPGDLVTIKLSSGLDKVYKFTVNASPITSPEGEVRGAMITFDDITELERKNTELQDAMVKLEQGQLEIGRQNQELHILATRDPLTNLLNRRSFLEGFESLFIDARQNHKQVACLMVDIDFFKLVNDQFGHPVGDIVIKLMADVLREASRPNDIVGRFGGEEFCLVLPETDSITAFGQAELIRTAVEESEVAEFKNRHSITTSIGVTNLSHGAKTVSELLEQADKALYVAKDTGRNRVVRWPMDLVKDTGPELTAKAIAKVVPRRRDRPETEGEMIPTLDVEGDVGEMIESQTGEVIPADQPELNADLPSPYMNINRTLLIDRINQAIVRSARYTTTVAVLAVEFDITQHVSELQDFAATDKIEQFVVQRLKDTLRSTDTVSVDEEGQGEQLISVLSTGLREVVILLPDLEDAAAINIILLRLFAATNSPIIVDGVEFFMDADIGISMYPQDGDDGNGLFSYANIAMKNAKRTAGKNNSQFYTLDINIAAKRQRLMEAELQQAVERGELVPHYQPKVSLTRGHITGTEVLLRWNHDEFGAVSPAEFIAVAEQSDLIDRITMRLITTACRQINSWAEAGYADLTVAVNLSPVSFRNPEIADQIIALVEENDVEATSIEFEITETVVMHNVQTAIEILERLSAAGFKIAIDDFGVGYSTFGYLKNFPIDCVKIDRSFISDLKEGPTAAAIISAIIAMAKSLRLTVVAEGVETEEELRFLQDLGCDLVQGYLLSKPLPANMVNELLANPASIKRMILKHSAGGEESQQSGATIFGIINEFAPDKAEPTTVAVKQEQSRPA